MEKEKKAGRIIDRVLFWTLDIILIVYCLSLLVPLIWMVLTSLKSYSEYYDNPFGFPSKVIWSNFSTAFNALKIEVLAGRNLITFNVWDMISTSLIYTTGSSLWVTLLSTLTAYTIARYKFKFCEFLYALGIFVMVVPIIGSSVSLMQVRRALGIYDNMLLTVLTGHSTAFSGFTFMLLYGACKSLPKSYDEAASIDGAGPYTIFFKIMLPMMLPLCTVVFVLFFLEKWNDYGVFMVWLPSYANLAYGVYKYQNDSQLYGATINEVMAGFALIMVPTMVMYLSFNKLIVSKFTVGGLKG